MDHELVRNNALLCGCGFDYTHQLGIEAWFPSREDGPTGTYAQIAGSQIRVSTQSAFPEGNPSSRRQGLTIAFECENHHRFELNIYQHKGQTFIVRSEPVEVPFVEPGPATGEE